MFVFAIVPLALAGCGVVYHPPSVSETDLSRSGYRVAVVPLTQDVVDAANLEPAPADQAGDLINASLVRTRDITTRMPPRHKPGSYRIGPGDELTLQQANLTATGLPDEFGRPARLTYTVQDNGRISIADVGSVRVGGLTYTEAQRSVLDAFLQQEIDPAFSLEISGFNSKDVAVGGAVRSPRLVPITLQPLTLIGALQEAGGTTALDFDQTVVRLHRDGQVYQMPLRALYGAQGRETIYLRDGDEIFVEALGEVARERTDTLRAQVATGALQLRHAYIVGENQGLQRFALPLSGTASLADAMYSQFGIPVRTGGYDRIYLVRGSAVDREAVTVYHLNAVNTANLVAAARMELRPDDFVLIAEHPITSWNRVISQLVPQQITGSVVQATAVGNN